MPRCFHWHWGHEINNELFIESDDWVTFTCNLEMDGDKIRITGGFTKIKQFYNLQETRVLPVRRPSLYSFLNIINICAKFNNDVYLYDNNVELCLEKSNIK